MKLNGVVVTNNDSDLRSSFEMVVDSSCRWADVCVQLNKDWESAMLNYNSDIANEIHEEDFAWQLFVEVNIRLKFRRVSVHAKVKRL